MGIPQFGHLIAGQGYIDRPGAYAVITDDRGRIATVRLPSGPPYYLPGGGIDPGESPEAALIREVAEELGWLIEVGDYIGRADEYVCVGGSGPFVRKLGSFYRARVVGEGGPPRELDHVLSWITLATAWSSMGHGSQLWALRQALDR